MVRLVAELWIFEFTNSFRCGQNQFEALRRTIERYCKENTHAIFADTMIEDEDLYRFLADQEWYFGITIERVKDGRTPWQVMKDEGYIMLRLSRCKKEMQRIVY